MAKGLRAALEAALRENPDDLAAHMAWADHAAEAGDPRGEFAQVQIALEDPSRPPAQRQELQAREAELLAKHRGEWLGPMAVMFGRTDHGADETFQLEYVRFDECRYRFARGWLDALHLDAVNPALLDAAARCPAAGLLRDFGVNCEHDPYNDGPDPAPSIAALAALPFLGTLRKFRLGYEDDQSRVHGDGLAAALAKMPRLEELGIYARSVEMEDVFVLPLPRLRSLVAHHLDWYPLEYLGDNPAVGNLIALDCFAHALEPDDDEAYITRESFERFVRSPHLKSLTHLTLKLHEVGEEGIAALVESGLLRRLKTLDLTGGNLTDAAARRLAASPDVRGLTRLVLTNNYLTGEGIAALRAAGAAVTAEQQFDPAALSGERVEREHLWYGDCE